MRKGQKKQKFRKHVFLDKKHMKEEQMLLLFVIYSL